jgi:2-polyprenyl-6-methoxyphenol hydroxylase-like FAD-dependent oxidoreductase
MQYGKRLSDIEITPSGPIAHFEDGTSEAGTIIIGADGASSRIRSWLFGDLAHPEALPYSFMNFCVRYTAPQALFLQSKMHPIVDVGIHPKSMYIGIFLLDKPDLDKPETWTYYILTTWPKTTREDEENTGDRLGRLRARMDEWAEPFKSAVEWVPDGTNIPRDELRVWAPPKLWDNHGGAVTLAGDAAHTMTFRMSCPSYPRLLSFS